MTSPLLPFAPELVTTYPDASTTPFWEAAREHRLVICRCAACGTFRMPPTPFCWSCRSQEKEWVELSGRGTVYTFTIARHALTPAAAEALPYVIAVIALDGAGDARLVSNVVGVAPEDVEVGMAVEVVFDTYDTGAVIPRFRPAG